MSDSLSSMHKVEIWRKSLQCFGFENVMISEMSGCSYRYQAFLMDFWDFKPTLHSNLRGEDCPLGRWTASEGFSKCDLCPAGRIGHQVWGDRGMVSWVLVRDC